MNPLVEWRLQHFVAFPRNDDGYVRHYFQFVDKEGVCVESSCSTVDHPGGLEHQCTAYRKQPEDAYGGLLNERGLWSMSISFLIELGRTLPTNTQPMEGHHVNGVTIGSRSRDAAAKAAEAPKSPHQWQKTPPPAPEPEPEEADDPDLDGFEIGAAIAFMPFNAMARIVDRAFLGCLAAA